VHTKNEKKKHIEKIAPTVHDSSNIGIKSVLKILHHI
jgi:hypothetical protein